MPTKQYYSLTVYLDFSQAECDMEGDLDNTTGETAHFVPIRADHITKIAAELLMDFS
jgi:hypothetical protein